MTISQLPSLPKRTARRWLALLAGLTAIIVFCSTVLFPPSSAQQPAADVAIDNDDIGGVVIGPKGPEAGQRPQGGGAPNGPRQTGATALADNAARGAG